MLRPSKLHGIHPPSSPVRSPAIATSDDNLAAPGDRGLYCRRLSYRFPEGIQASMSLERARKSVQRLREIAAGQVRVSAPALSIDPGEALALFQSQLLCRLIDVESHELRARGEGYYTICSAGHEGNVVLGRLTRHTDPALLHY